MSRNNNKIVPTPAIKRMPYYLAYVKGLKKRGEEYVSSKMIADYMHIDPSQITKDLSYTDIIGKTRVGYQVDSFIKILRDFLSFNIANKAFLVGAGSLGSALLHDKGISNYGLIIDTAFDIDKEKVGQEINNIKIEHMDQFRHLTEEKEVEIGIITTPVDVAQAVADLMVAWGIKAIWNFTPTKLQVHEGIIVEHTTMYSNIASLLNKLKNENNN